MVSLSGRPNSLLVDTRLPKKGRDELAKDIIQSISKDINNNKLSTIVMLLNNEVIGFATYEEVKYLSSIIGKPWVRINEIVIIPYARSQGRGTHLMLETMQFIVEELGKDLIIEIFSKMDNWAFHKVLIKCNFQLVHGDITLHRLIK